MTRKLHLYTISGSPRGWRVLLALMVKGLEYDVTYLKLSEKEHKTDGYLRLNPRGTVPSLRTGTGTITDSIASMVWLDKAHPDVPLFGRSADEAAEIWAATREVTGYLREATRALLTPVFFGPNRPNPADLAGAVEQTEREVAILESRLRRSEAYLAGDQPTAVDLVAYPELRLIERAIETQGELMQALGFGETVYRSDLLVRWRERIESFDGFEKTLPLHWS